MPPKIDFRQHKSGKKSTVPYCNMYYTFITFLSSAAEKRYGCLGDTARPRMQLMCPVSVSFSPSDAPAETFARSHTLIVRSADPVTNHSFPGSNATARTHPRCPDTTAASFHGACHLGRGAEGAARRDTTSWLVAPVPAEPPTEAELGLKRTRLPPPSAEEPPGPRLLDFCLKNEMKWSEIRY